ncbi:DUF3887 domain-containing protein [Thermococcus waiotapuensis]|uniref:DUF3887 domain-containing protein n=1 Tax=Thermococcus waiotapuensis TaxID=90909 RepID=A0AAE4T3K1_9EURY|nr:DUF3887 domain-containing protein [Thermococcus waiotapuensis]MDV3103883.1 DUF3887 domain-containing protein [Thermococcus waiotapuensis]
MKNAAVTVVLFSLLSLFLSPALSTPQSEFMDSFIEAINTGNYSAIEPYLSGELREQFTEDYFEQIRDFTLDNYGKLKGYELTSNSTGDDLEKFEYRIYCEKGSFPVLLAYNNSGLVGIALGIRARPNPAGMLLMILGSLISLGALYSWRRKLETAELVMGAGIALVLGIILPFYSIITLGVSRTASALTVALLTALTVEGAKYYFSKNRDGLSLGLGLGIGQYVLLSIGTFVTTNFILELPVSFSGGLSYVFLSALVFTAFHGISAMLYSRRKVSHFLLFTAFEFPALALTSLGMPAVGIGVITVAVVAGFALNGGIKRGIAR